MPWNGVRRQNVSLLIVQFETTSSQNFRNEQPAHKARGHIKREIRSKRECFAILKFHHKTPYQNSCRKV